MVFRSTPFFAALDRFGEALGETGGRRIAERFVVYGGGESQERNRGRLVSWRKIDGVDWTAPSRPS